MEPLLMAIVTGLVVYVLAVAIIPRRWLSRAVDHTQQSLDTLEQDYSAAAGASILRERPEPTSVLARAFMTLPGAADFYARMVKAGLERHVDLFLLGMGAVWLCASFLLKAIGVWCVPAGLLVAVLAGRWYVRQRIARRNAAFLNLFPDALDMIVRSLRSGYPINAAVRMVADNVQSPVAEEFRQVADEAAYGSSLVDALRRLSQRVDEPDIHFFVVVLAVQQEVGGNLAEVLSNLSGIIRKRKHLRLKVKALTSEGVAASWVLGMLPLFEFIMIHIFSPSHLEPFFTTTLGHMLLATAIGIVLLGLFIVRKMINIDV